MPLDHHLVELLAPARDVEIAKEAILHGADAIYIGGPSFGARSNASNDMRDISGLVEFAHRYHSRVFLTLNTILRDDELEPAQRIIHQAYDAGVDALIIQDMGLLELDLPPIDLHASTQCDIRTPEKALFLQNVGFSQLVLARELTLEQIADIRAATSVDQCAIEFFVHGALCVAYSGQCYISHAHTGRSANRGDCSQACRLPYQVLDAQGRLVAHEKHVLSLKDNNQSDNLAALIQAGVRSFKIEGRYKDMAYVKNITAHYRQLLDQVLEGSSGLSPSSHGKVSLTFKPDPDQNFNRGSTDYFVNGRQSDIGAFETPKHSGTLIGWVDKVQRDSLDVLVQDQLSNGDGLTYLDTQGQLQGLALNRVECLDNHVVVNWDHLLDSDAAFSRWRVWPKDPMDTHAGIKPQMMLRRNRDMRWVRQLEKPSATRLIPITMQVWLDQSEPKIHVSVCDSHQHEVHLQWTWSLATPATQPDRVKSTIRESLTKWGATQYQVTECTIHGEAQWFIPVSQLNIWRRQMIEALNQVREQTYIRHLRHPEAQPLTQYPENHLTYLANVFNHKANDFYRKHGVQWIDAAYESHEEKGEVSLMITKHCVRFSMSLCPKQAKGVTGVQGQVRAEPMALVNGKEKLTLRFDCKACEMHVMGSIKSSVLNEGKRNLLNREQPIRFYQSQDRRP